MPIEDTVYIPFLVSSATLTRTVAPVATETSKSSGVKYWDENLSTVVSALQTILVIFVISSQVTPTAPAAVSVPSAYSIQVVPAPLVPLRSFATEPLRTE